MNQAKHRLVTRADFDGVVCGALLMEKGLVSEVVFAHPRELQNQSFPVTDDDIIANLPYAEGAHLCFDHHVSETYRTGDHENLVLDPDSPSTARVIYQHYGGADAFPDISLELLTAVDKADSADFKIEEILVPEDWVLLNFILDQRTGLETFKDFALSRDDFLIELISFCRRNPVDEIIHHPDVEERLSAYLFHNEFAELQISRCSRVHGQTVITDYRNEEKKYPGNRFMTYALYPDTSLSIQVSNVPETDRVELALGKSIIDRSSPINVGQLMLDYGGGGHTGAGTCQVENDKADDIVEELLERIDAQNASAG
jgi:nanoRNase/pAp phosphatase (c-di-AMP/oligoRNAs hydrolase)